MFKIDNKKFIKIIEDFINIPAVSGFETQIENYIGNICDKKNINNTVFPGFGICVGNPNCKNYVIAHTDEVGGKITEVGEKVRFEGIGRVKPEMFVGREIEIISGKRIISAIVVGNIPLKVNYQDFNDLEIVVCESDKKYLKVGISLRYKRNFIETEDGIFSTSLDNRISVSTLIYLIDFFREELNSGKICFCFAGEEEVKNKGALFFINNFSPKKYVIPDVFPMSFLGKCSLLDKNIILEKTLDYKINKDLKNILQKNDFLFVNSNLDLLKRSEVSQYELINGGVGVSIGIPVLNYHSGTYFTNKKLIKKFLEDNYFLIKNFLK